MNHHLFAAALTSGLLTLAGLSVGCSDPPTPLPQPALSAPTVNAISPAAGLGGDILTISGSGFRPGATVSLGGVPAVVASNTGSLITLRAPAHAPGSVDVVVSNGSQTAVLAEAFTYQAVSLTVSSNVVAAGSKVSVSWIAPNGRASADWVAIFGVHDDNDHHGWFEHTGGATSGTMTLTAPSQPGFYEFRYLVGNVAVTRSSPVAIATAEK